MEIYPSYGKRQTSGRRSHTAHKFHPSLEVEHVVIRIEDYVAGTHERPEVGVFTQTHSTRRPVPWGHISAGDVIWMKWTSGPIVAKALVPGNDPYVSTVIGAR